MTGILNRSHGVCLYTLDDVQADCERLSRMHKLIGMPFRKCDYDFCGHLAFKQVFSHISMTNYLKKNKSSK